MLIVPYRTYQFESIRIECNLTTKNTMKQKQLVDISYNPRKYLFFLEELSLPWFCSN